MAAAPARKAAPRPGRRHHHHVDVVELSDRGCNDPRFGKANRDHRLGMPFACVGMTGLDPDLRFDRHKAGIQANRFVLEQGLRLQPALQEVYNPIPSNAALDIEMERGTGLRQRRSRAIVDVRLLTAATR